MSSASTTPLPLYDGYATIRSRGLCRSQSIRRASEIEAEAKTISSSTTPTITSKSQSVDLPIKYERKRTLSLKSNLSQNSSYSAGSAGHTPQHQHYKQQQQSPYRSTEERDEQQPLYINSTRARPVRTPTVAADYEPLYASANSKTFRPLSDSSSSSSAGGCRDSVTGSTGSNGLLIEYQNIKKNSRFSLDSLQSSATPKTPDYATAEEEQFFLYTAPASPKRVTNAAQNHTERCYTPPSAIGATASPRNSFEMQELSSSSSRRRFSQSGGGSSSAEHSQSASPTKSRHSTGVTRHYAATPSIPICQRAQSLVENSQRPATLLMRMQRSDSESPTYVTRTSPTQSQPPQTPVRRESLYQSKPKIYATPNSVSQHDSAATSPSHCCPPVVGEHSATAPRITYYQVPTLNQRSSSAEILERSYTSQSLATIDQDEILQTMPTAMPVLQHPFDRRYHTLGHMRVKSMGASLHLARDSPMGSMLNMMSATYYGDTNGVRHYMLPHKSAGNIYASAEAAVADLDRLAPEYVDPLDFKIGCQTTLRSKPIIPWYELAIRRDFKRQSCPPISGDSMTNGSNTTISTMSRLSQGNQAHVVAAFEQSLSNMTSRLQQLTATAERKDGELTDMRQTIELLRKQSIQAGLTTAHMQSMGVHSPQSHNPSDIFGKSLSQLPPALPGHMNRMAHQQQQQQQLQQSPAHSGSGMQTNINGNGVTTNAGGVMQRNHSSDSMCSLNSISSGCSAHDKKKKKGWLRSSFTKAFSRNAKISKTSRHTGSGSHHSSHLSGINHTDGVHSSPKSKPLGAGTMNGHEPAGLAALATQPAALPTTSPLKNSPAKTVTLIENAKPIDAIEHDEQHVVEELKKQLREKDLVLTDIRLEALSSASQLESLKEIVNKMRAEMMSLKQNNERLQKLVTSRSLAGSEVSLGNPISPNGSIGESRRYSLADGNTRPPMELPKRLEEEVEEENIPPAPAPEPPPPPLSPTTHIDLTPPPPAIDPIPSPAHMPSTVEDLPDVTDGKKIAIACYLGQPESFVKYCEEMLEADEFYANGSVLLNAASSSADAAAATAKADERNIFPASNHNEFIIAFTYISGKTTWQNLDYIVRKTFKDYVSRIDPGTNLGLNTDSITSYHLGEAKRGPEMGFPELLPCGYIIGNVRTLYICLQGVGSLAFDSLIPRSIVHRYISLLTEHRRLILCGPSGTGKSYLARRLAEFLVARSGRGNPSEAIATFNVDHKSSKELRQYLGHIAEQAAIANGASELPSVIILDNLHHASALGDVFSSLLSSGPAAKLPCIIGTMSQATCNTTNLQLHHNFRWVLTANHMEPVKGFLGRFLRRRLFQLELQTQHPQPELATVLAWLPTVWQHINRFLEVHSSSDVTIGPRLFLACPLDLKDSQVWFTDIWNYHLSPYLVEAVREGVQLYGRRGGAWNDPSAFIRNSYPWPYGPDSVPPLRQINAEDVGLEGIPTSNGDSQDPLLNMLMRLQEAANYSENQEQESDCASLDSNITPDSSAGAE